MNLALILGLVLKRAAGLFAMPAVGQGMQVQSESHPKPIDAAVSIFLVDQEDKTEAANGTLKALDLCRRPLACLRNSLRPTFSWR